MHFVYPNLLKSTFSASFHLQMGPKEAFSPPPHVGQGTFQKKWELLKSQICCVSAALEQRRRATQGIMGKTLYSSRPRERLYELSHQSWVKTPFLCL